MLIKKETLFKLRKPLYFHHDFKIVYLENKGSKLILMKSLEINKLKYSTRLLNDKLYLNTYFPVAKYALVLFV